MPLATVVVCRRLYKAAIWYVFNIVYVYIDNCKLCVFVM